MLLGACDTSDRLAASYQLMQTSRLVSADAVPSRRIRVRREDGSTDPVVALESARVNRLTWRDRREPSDKPMVDLSGASSTVGAPRR